MIVKWGLVNISINTVNTYFHQTCTVLACTSNKKTQDNHHHFENYNTNAHCLHCYCQYNVNKQNSYWLWCLNTTQRAECDHNWV